MDRSTLQVALLEMPTSHREALYAQPAELPALDFAVALKQLYFSNNLSSPNVAHGAAAALTQTSP